MENCRIVPVAVDCDHFLLPLLHTVILLEAWIHYPGEDILVEIQSSFEQDYTSRINP